ncbi:MAG: transglycosylase SLT domain-containing protein [Rickettsiaceae bacterium]|nr:transglycosylase SLT domain-containing protein [Rickettsiaceae bacterium]
MNSLANDLEAKAYKAMQDQKWAEAKKLAELSKNNVLLNIIISNQYLDCNYKDKNFAEIINFLSKVPNWPQNDSLQIIAENSLDEKTSAALIVKFFNQYNPLTSKGWKYYAKALYQIDPKASNLPLVIKQAWIKGKFSPEEQQEYYKKFGKYLASTEHIKRINQLIIDRKITEAKSMYKYLDAKSKKSFDAQIALLKTPQNSDKILKSLSKDCYTPGVIYQYLENMKKQPLNANKAFELVSLVKDGTQYGNLIWHAQHYISREYIDKKRYKEAYRAIELHHATENVDISNAEFLAGWLALEFINSPQIALKHFKKFLSVVSRPISRSRGLYWLGRAYEKLGDKQTANDLYSSVAELYPYSFYGQIAIMEMGGKKLIIQDDFDVAKYKIKADSQILLDKTKVFEATQLVAKYGSDNMARTYITFAASQIKNVSEAQDFIYLLYKANNIHYINWLARNILFNGIMLKNYSYPLPYKCNQLYIEEALAYAIIKQESAFNKMAKSSADAKGLMQLLESTACGVALEIDGHYKSGELQKNECYNIKLGSHYLRALMEKYDDSYILAIASYNAGFDKVDQWLERFGDVRKLQNVRDVINWMEMIPYAETRNYVQRVLENLEVYRSILNPQSTLQMKTNLIQSASKR